MLLRSIYNTIQNEKLRPYEGRYTNGIRGAIRGIVNYYRYGRRMRLEPYVNYYIVRSITGRDPLREKPPFPVTKEAKRWKKYINETKGELKTNERYKY